MPCCAAEKSTNWLTWVFTSTASGPKVKIHFYKLIICICKLCLKFADKWLHFFSLLLIPCQLLWDMLLLICFTKKSNASVETFDMFLCSIVNQMWVLGLLSFSIFNDTLTLLSHLHYITILFYFQCRKPLIPNVLNLLTMIEWWHIPYFAVLTVCFIYMMFV